MTQVNFIIENWAKEKSYDELSQAVLDCGHILHKFRDFKVNDWIHWTDKCVVFLGSIQITKQMISTLGGHCHPVAWMYTPNYLCSKYYSQFGDLLFNDRYSLISLSELVRNKFFYYGIFGKDGQIFLRPDSGDKLFQAQLVDLQDLDKFFENNQAYQHELVLVSTPKNIRGEYRFVVSAENGIIAHSTYRYQGLRTLIPAVPKEAKEKCLDVLNCCWHPDPVYVIDIVEDSDGDFWLLELNSFSSAGLYACDKYAIVKSVSEIAQKEFEKFQLTTRLQT